MSGCRDFLVDADERKLTLHSNFAGYSSRRKHKLYETQVRARLEEMGILNDFDILEFQMIGNAREDPRYMFESTSYSRIFAQSRKKEVLSALKLLLADQTQQKPSVRSSPKAMSTHLLMKAPGSALGARYANSRPKVLLRLLPMYHATGRN